MKVNSRGNLLVSLSDGNGFFNKNGNVNITMSSPDKLPGTYAPDGSVYVTAIADGGRHPLYNADGSWNARGASIGDFGLYSPSGPFWVVIE